jgi:exopolysaccharide production protein ExoQ
MISLAPTDAIRRIGLCFEFGLDAAAFLFLPILVLVPRGIAPLAAVAGVLAIGLIMPNGMAALRALQLPAMLLGALLVWATVSASWSVTPAHSLVTAAHLGGLFAAGLALTVAADALAFPRRLLFCFYAGLAVALFLSLLQFTTGGSLTRPFMTRGFFAPQLNQAADTLAILVLPASATLITRNRARLPLLLAAAIAVVICSLVGTAAKIALGAGIVLAAVLYISPRNMARAAALLSALIIITAPLTFSQLARLDDVAEMAERIKFSAWHRLMIWSFAGDRMAERPLSGWGLDASRAIPGGKEPIYEGRVWLPLHPHNAAIQLWLELGVPGATLFALVVAWLWRCLAAACWPRLFTAAVGASLGTAFMAAIGAYGIWQEWWIGTLWFSLFLILVMARCIPIPASSLAPARQEGRAPGRSDIIGRLRLLLLRWLGR